MPVSKKRKKDGKTVHMKETAIHQAEEHHAAPEAKPAVPQVRAGKPSNPFVANQQSKRGAQRGR